jgi:ketosteroid isomerase-like protein
VRTREPTRHSLERERLAESVVRRYYELVDAGNFREMAKLFTADIIYRRPGYGPMFGLEQVLKYYTSVRIIESGKHELHTVISRGSMVAVAGTFRGQVKVRGMVRQEFADFFAVADGKINARSTYFDAPAL